MSVYLKTPAPHIRSSESASLMMWTFFASLIPAFIGALVFSGWDALRVLILSIAAGMLSEIFSQKTFRKYKKKTTHHTAVTAILFTFMLPDTAPGWMVILGIVFSILIVREAFGGLGSSPFHAAVAGRVFLQISFPAIMSGPAMMSDASAWWPFTMLFLFGGLILIWKKLIYWEIPILYLAILFFLSAFTGVPFWESFDTAAVYFVAFYLIADLTTTPMTRFGHRAFAIGAAFLSLLLNMEGAHYLNAAVIAVLLMNALTPWIDGWINVEVLQSRKK